MGGHDFLRKVPVEIFHLWVTRRLELSEREELFLHLPNLESWVCLLSKRIIDCFATCTDWLFWSEQHCFLCDRCCFCLCMQISRHLFFFLPSRDKVCNWNSQLITFDWKPESHFLEGLLQNNVTRLNFYWTTSPKTRLLSEGAPPGYWWTGCVCGLFWEELTCFPRLEQLS